MKLMAAIFALALMCGCSHTNKNGVRTHLVVGFGLVRVTNTNETVGSVLSVKALGLYAGSGSATIGWVNQTSVSVKTNSNVILEIKK